VCALPLSSPRPRHSLQPLDHNQYSTWNRTRRLQASPFLARTDTRTSRTATAMARSSARDTVVVNVGSNGALGRDKKQLETLFGPNIGVVNSTPPWTQPISKQAALDKLSPEIIQTWIAKSKEVLIFVMSSSYPDLTLASLPNPPLPCKPLSISSAPPFASSL